MKTKFTKRSASDKTLVTVSLSQFIGSEVDRDQARLVTGKVGEELILVIEGVPTVFTYCRPNKDGVPTAATSHGYPRFLRLPRVGRPVYAEVSEIR